MEIATLGIDLAKSVFLHYGAFRRPGAGAIHPI